MNTESEQFTTERKTVTTRSMWPASMALKPVETRLMWAESTDGKRLFKIEHAGAWDAPDDDESDDRRSGCYYEDDELPAGAISLYRVTEVTGMKRRYWRSFRRWLRSGRG